MGHLAKVQQTTIDKLPYDGFSLVFGTWPVVFGTFDGGIHWVRLLFVNLFLLGIDSGFSILESPVCVFTDWFHAAGMNVPMWAVSGAGCLICFLVGIVYGTSKPCIYEELKLIPMMRAHVLFPPLFCCTATDAGLYFLDSVDFYINFVLLIIGLMETFSAGWMANIDKQIASLGHGITLTYMIGTFGTVLFACCVWFGVDGDAAVWSGFLVLIVGYISTAVLTLFLCSRKMSQDPDTWTWSSIIYEVTLSNVMVLREELQSVCGWIPWAWAFMMKHFIPQVLLILFVNLAASKNEDGEPKFGFYENYVGWPYQVLGIGAVGIAIAMFLAGVFYPDIYKKADLYALEQEQKAQEKDLSMDSAEDSPKEDGVVEADA